MTILPYLDMPDFRPTFTADLIFPADFTERLARPKVIVRG